MNEIMLAASEGMPAYLLILIVLFCAAGWWLVSDYWGAKIKQPFKGVILFILLAIVAYYLLVATGLLSKIKGIETPHVKIPNQTERLI